MQINASVDYAVRAVVEIASSSDVVRKKDLVSAQDMPTRFLENILAQLVRSGILTATRGPQGGYSMARPATEVTVADIVRAVDGPLAAVRGLAPEGVTYPPNVRAVQDVWIAVRASLRTVLEGTTVDDLVAGSLPEPVTGLLKHPGARRRR